MTVSTSAMTTDQQQPGQSLSLLSRWLAAVLSVRYVQQFLLLTWKNLLVAWRNRRATLLRLLAPFVFLLLALLIQLALDANSRRQLHIRETGTTSAQAINPIPSCHDDIFIASRACVTFLYSPNTSRLVQDIITNIRTRNSPAIAEDQVLGFASRADAEGWMMSHPESSLGAVHFTVNEGASPPALQYIIQTNTTTKGFRGEYQSPVTFFTMPLTSAVAREASRVQLAAAGGQPESLQWNPQLAHFPHPQLRSIGMVGYVLGPFIFAACMFGIVMQLGAVVAEKEGGLLTALRLMGLRQSAYWTSWVAVDLLLGLATALSIVIWGLVLQFRFFLRNDVGLLLLLFWLFTLALSSFSYFLSVFMSRAQSATYTGFAVFLVGWICQTVVIFGVPYDPETYFAPSGVGRAFFWIFALLPWCPLSKATQDLASATNSERSPGLRWSERQSYCQYITDGALQPPVDPTVSYVDFDCLFPINQCYITLLLQALGWLLLAVHLDNVLPGPNKRARAPWYFLLPSYWVRRQGARCGLSARQQQQLLAQATAQQQQATTGCSGDGASSSSSRRAGPKQSAELQLQAGRSAWGGGVAQHQHQEPHARLDMSGGYTGSNGSSTDEDVAAEEAVMQTLLPELMPTRFAAAAARRLSGAGSAKLTSVPSWPHLHSAVSHRRPDSTGGNRLNDAAAAAAEVSGSGDTQDRQQAASQGGNGSTTDTGSSSSSSGYDFCGYAVAVLGLSKVFKGAACCVGCCGGGGAAAAAARDFHALRSVWLGIKPGQLFALLGPNGAGKTTMIHCLTGLLPPSGGELLVCGESILTEGGCDRATGLIGVCPQFDVLWGELTGREHLLVAGHVKGLPWAQVPGAADALLSRVQLSAAAGVRSSAYSGGMKRRLSVALALVGDPRVLFLDEPTTGMDPISRRAVWDVIQEAKLGRAVVLTTHSMEEADVLGDRIGIMARGRLRALGGSIRLKQKFGTGYQVQVTLLDTRTTQPVSDTGLRQRRRGPHNQQLQLDKATITPTPTPTTTAPTATAAALPVAYQQPYVGVAGPHLEQQQQQVGLSPRSVILGQVSSGPAPAASALSENAHWAPLQPQAAPAPPSVDSTSSATSSNSNSTSGGGGSSGDGPAVGPHPTPPGLPRTAATAATAATPATSATRAAVRALFASHLSGLTPSEENRRSLQYLVPRQQQQQLVGLLQQLEAAMAGSGSSSSSSRHSGVSDEVLALLHGGVADVQLSLTSLEEVFLAIAKQAELESAAGTGATVTITLPDTGEQCKVAVGQDWVVAAGQEAASSDGRVQRMYFVKWVQDESGALAVLEVVPAARQQQQRQHLVPGSTAVAAYAAVAPVAL